jgi:hypothetical protein
MRLRDGEMGLGLRTRSGRHAPSMGGPGRGVVKEAPAAEAARVSEAAEAERRREAERRGGE